MSLSSRSIVGFAVVGVVLLAVPALAQNTDTPDAASYTAFDTAGPGTFRWYVTGTMTTDVTIAQHGTVTFTNPTSTSKPHNVVFSSNQASQCKLSTDSAASTPPMPATPTGGQWSGTCVFDQPGTYGFYCKLHPVMSGTITVVAAPASTPTPTPAATSSPAPPPGPAAPAPRPAAATAIAVKHHQARDPRVKGSLLVSRPGTRVEIVVLSRRVALGLSGRRRVPVGRSVVAAAGAGQMRFTIALNATARRALRARRTLPVLVRVKASAPATASVESRQAVRLGRVPSRSQSSR